MKMFIKNSYLFLIFFILFFSKSFLCGMISPKEIIEYDDIYIKKLEKEIEDIKIIQNNEYRTIGIYGKVLYQNPYKFNKELVIAMNGSDLKKNNYVISNEGLIGVVDKIYKNYIIVKMLLNSDILLQVKVNDCYGILKYNDYLHITNTNNYCFINTGDKVYTSNLGYQDEEILIGKIGKINAKENGVENIYEVIPAANFNNLNYVVILTGGDL